MGVLAGSYVGSKSAVAWSDGMSPERQAERSEAYAQKEASDQRLRELEATKLSDADLRNKSEIQSKQLEELLQNQTQAVRDGNRRLSIDAFDRYDNDVDENGDKNIEHLNTMFAEIEKNGGTLFGGIARIDALTFLDIPMMDRDGVSKEIQKGILSDPEQAASYGKLTMRDGTTKFGDIDSVKAGTGYKDFATTKEMTRMTQQRQREFMAKMGYPASDANALRAFEAVRAQLGENADPNTPEFRDAFDAKMAEYAQENKLERSYSPRVSDQKDYVNSQLEAEGLEPGTQEYARRRAELVKEYKNLADPAAVKTEGKVQEAEAALKENGFLEADLSQLTDIERMEYEPHIRAIENFGKAKLSTGMLDQLQDVAELMYLGDKAGEITPEQTGILDSFLYNMKQYIFDVVPETQATAAYQSLMNVSRHDLFGSVLPTSERADFVKAFGSLGQQQGPVLDKLRSFLDNVRHGFETMQDLGHPMVMKYRTGKTGREIRNTIRKLDERIEMLNTLDADVKPEGAPDLTADPGRVDMTPEREAELKTILNIPTETTNEN